MKRASTQKPKLNKLCVSCRRHCKQVASALVASCPRYYQGPKIKECTWKQLELPWK